MKTPPDYAIESARKAALRSPCAKSKRGVVLFCGEDTTEECVVVAGEGFNGPPPGFACDRSDACRRDCAKLCLHAEDRAIRQALVEWSAPPLDDVELLHVKVVDGQVVPGGGPSCWQCSRLVVEAGLRGVWLYEQTGIAPSGGGALASWRFYTAEEFHRTTLRASEIGDQQ